MQINMLRWPHPLWHLLIRMEFAASSLCTSVEWLTALSCLSLLFRSTNVRCYFTSSFGWEEAACAVCPIYSRWLKAQLSLQAQCQLRWIIPITCIKPIINVRTIASSWAQFKRSLECSHRVEIYIRRFGALELFFWWLCRIQWMDYAGWVHLNSSEVSLREALPFHSDCFPLWFHLK